MLRNRLLFSQNDKNKSQARTAISRKPRAAHNISLRSKPKAKLAAILPALVVAFTGTVAAGSTFSAMAANNENGQIHADTKENVEKNNAIEKDIDDFEYNQDIPFEEEIRSPGWLRLQKKLNEKK